MTALDRRDRVPATSVAVQTTWPLKYASLLKAMTGDQLADLLVAAQSPNGFLIDEIAARLRSSLPPGAIDRFAVAQNSGQRRIYTFAEGANATEGE